MPHLRDPSFPFSKELFAVKHFPGFGTLNSLLDIGAKISKLSFPDLVALAKKSKTGSHHLTRGIIHPTFYFCVY